MDSRVSSVGVGRLESVRLIAKEELIVRVRNLSHRASG